MTPSGATPDLHRSQWPVGQAGRLALLLGIVFIAALAIRGLHLWGQARHNPFFYAPTMDEEVHHRWALRVASGEGFGPHPFFRAPLYYYLLGWLYALFGPSLAVARAAGCVLGAATCSLIAWLGMELDGRKTGVLAGLLAAFYWPFIHFDGLLLTVGLETFLGLLLLLLLMRAAARGSPFLFVLAGIAWGLAAITRPTILAFAPAVVLWSWMARRRLAVGFPGPKGRRLEPPGRNAAAAVLRSTALVFAGAAIVILPVTIRNRAVGGEWVLIASYGGVNFYIGNNPQADGVAAIVPGTRADWQGGYEDTHRIPEVELGRTLSESEVSRYWFRKGLSWIRDDPRAWLRLMVRKFRLFWSPVEIPNNQPDWFFAKLSETGVLYWIGFPVVAGLGLAGFGLLVRERRAWALAWLYALVNMATVVMFFCPGRYRLPFVPILILMAAAGVVRLPAAWRARRYRPLIAYAVCGIAAGAFLATNPPDRAMHRRETEGRGHLDLGLYYAGQSPQRPELGERAYEHLQAATRLRPNDPLAHTALGIWLLKRNRLDEAGAVLARAVEVAPQNAEAQGYYGDYLYAAGRLDEAVACYQRAAELNPTWPSPHTSLGFVLARLGRPAEACAHLETSLRLKPDQTDAQLQLGLLLSQQGQYASAVEQFEGILKREPAHTAALLNLGTALATLERYEAAAARYREVLRHEPGSAPAAQGLAFALQKSGRVAEAIAVLKEALRHGPDEERLLRGLAWLLATSSDPELRDGRQAVELAERAMQRTQQPGIGLLNALAAALAEAGQFERAVTVCQQALEKARSAGQQELAEQLEARLRLYQQGQPYREGG